MRVPSVATARPSPCHTALRTRFFASLTARACAAAFERRARPVMAGSACTSPSASGASDGFDSLPFDGFDSDAFRPFPLRLRLG